MNRTELLSLAKQLLTLPTAPYHEHHISQFVTEYGRALGLTVTPDPVGNLVMKLPSTSSRPMPPLVFVAHMDHPGFEILDTKRAQFLGGVPTEMFAGSRFRVQTASGPAIARITRVIDPKKKILAIAPVPARAKPGWATGDYGMWDLPLYRATGDRLRAIAIDDVLSVVVALATMSELKRRRCRMPVWAVFTRAEEVGFHGAIEIAKTNRIPRAASVISLEMSKERPWARIGCGPIIRVGDRLTTFDPTTVYHLQTVAGQLQQERDGFQWQRALMDGGSCEASAFAGFGYRTAGLCLPLGNYHNIGPGKKPQPEYVSISDLAQLVELAVAAGQRWQRVDRVHAAFVRRIQAIRRTAPRKLRR
jgi:endoglucanase